jgi:hypothetical protein
MTDQPVQLDAAAIARLEAGTGTPEEATAWLAQKRAAFDGPAPPVAPSNAVEGAARLQHLMSGKDPEWMKRFFAGNVETVKEFHALTKMRAEADEADLAMAGVKPNHLEFEARIQGKASLREMTETVPYLRAIGIPDLAIEHYLKDLPVEPEAIAAAKLWKAQAMSSAEFVAALLRGDIEARGRMTAANMILTSTEAAK